MLLSDLSVRRPVLATVFSLVVVTLGIVSLFRLPVRELPDIDAPTVSVSTNYPGAAAAVVETRVTQVVENAISGIDGIRTISSQTSDGRAEINIEFHLERDLDAAANDVRDRVSRVLDQLPDEIDPPEVSKVDTGSDTSFWMNLASPVRDALELTDYIERYVADQFANVPGVAAVRYGGGSRYAMRIWLSRESLAATGITSGDVEAALRRENVELPAGRIESTAREFTVRVKRRYHTAQDFGQLVVGRGQDGHLLRLADVARVELGPSNDRTVFRRNGEDMVGIGIIAQAKANVLDVIEGVKQRMTEVNASLPSDMQLYPSSDSSVYIRAAIDEVYATLFITALVVMLVIFLFLGSGLATMIPAVTVPVSLIGTFLVLDLLGFSVNLLTLLGLVLAIGLVVDDAIVVLENIARRIRDGEPPLRAAYLGSRQVGFAVIATTVVLVAVLVPVSFVEGNTGRLFREFALALAGAVVLSTFVALTLSPVMCSLLLKGGKPPLMMRFVDYLFEPVQRGYRWVVSGLVAQPLAALGIAVGLGLAIGGLYDGLHKEYAPQEDRGQFRISARGPEGASFEHAVAAGLQVEKVMLALIASGEAQRVLLRVPGGWNSSGSVNSAFGTVLLKLWGERERTTKQVMAEVDRQLGAIPGYRAFTIAESGLLRRSGQPVQFVLTGSSFEDLAKWRDVVLDAARKNPGLVAVNSDYEETKPQLEVVVDDARAADLGVASVEVGRTLETLMGSRRVTTFVERGEEYDVMLEAEDQDKRSPADLEQVYVRSQTTGKLIPLANVVKVREFADSATRNRYDRLRSIAISANLAEDYTLGEALDFLRSVVRDQLQNRPGVAYAGQSREFVESSDALMLTFVMSLLLVYLALAAQFESFLQPLVILLTVPLALFGGLLGLKLGGGTLNIYSQVGMVILIGLATKNGILIVEFANQLRDEGRGWRDAVIEASVLRLRPILMTGLSTSLGALPLVIASGAGAEGRIAIGLVVLYGVTIATLTTLLVVPGTYGLVARFTGSPQQRDRELQQQLGADATPPVDDAAAARVMPEAAG
ncbi:MAG: efflux RND transporter permease subunit [Planctomycetes bacterium]|nr:efflux RND transporter permease subunit [Planctomycetota bacterium]